MDLNQSDTFSFDQVGSISEPSFDSKKKTTKLNTFMQGGKEEDVSEGWWWR